MGCLSILPSAHPSSTLSQLQLSDASFPGLLPQHCPASTCIWAVSTNLASGHTSASGSNSDTSPKGYFMRQSGSYEIYKASNSPTFSPGLNPHSLVRHSRRLMFPNLCFQWLPSPLIPFKLYTPAKYNYLYKNHVFPLLGFCNTRLFTSIHFLLISTYPSNPHKFRPR